MWKRELNNMKSNITKEYLQIKLNEGWYWDNSRPNDKSYYLLPPKKSNILYGAPVYWQTLKWDENKLVPHCI